MDLELEGKVALITGAAGGIGSATARVLAAEGVDVVVHYNSSETRAKKLTNELGKNTLNIKADLSSESQVLEMFKEIEKKKGRIDILICNAAIWPEDYIEIEKMTLERWKLTMTIDLDSVFLCCRSFIQQLRKYDGESASIVIVGSTSAVFGVAGHADYAAAKAAIIASIYFGVMWSYGIIGLGFGLAAFLSLIGIGLIVPARRRLKIEL